MIWGWPIFFRVAQNGVRRRMGLCRLQGVRRTLCASNSRPAVIISILAIALGMPLSGGSVTGRVELRDSHVASVRKSRDYSGVVIWLLPAAGVPARSAEGKHARLIQKDKTFTPHVLAIESGKT